MELFLGRAIKRFRSFALGSARNNLKKNVYMCVCLSVFVCVCVYSTLEEAQQINNCQGKRGCKMLPFIFLFFVFPLTPPNLPFGSQKFL